MAEEPEQEPILSKHKPPEGTIIEENESSVDSVKNLSEQQQKQQPVTESSLELEWEDEFID